MKEISSSISSGLEAYKQKQVLITGGLGFLGANLALALLAAGAKVRILDPKPMSNALKFFQRQIRFYEGELRNRPLVEEAVRDCEIIFNLAGKSGATTSNNAPLEYLDANVRGQLIFLESCRSVNPKVKVVFPSSRLVYKPTNKFPVTETALIDPLSIYGVHKLTIEYYHVLYARLYGLRTTILRITNPYGPFHPQEQNRYGVINWFIHLAINGQTLPIYGDGNQIRDYVHVDDVTRAFLLSGTNPLANGRIFNVGGGQSITFKKMASLITKITGRGKLQYREWPLDAARVETGGFIADISLIKDVIGWEPRIRFETGLIHVINEYIKAIKE